MQDEEEASSYDDNIRAHIHTQTITRSNRLDSSHLQAKYSWHLCVYLHMGGARCKHDSKKSLEYKKALRPFREGNIVINVRNYRRGENKL